MPIKVNLKKLNEKAQLPKKATEGDFCYDVYATDREEIMPNVFKYKLGFSYEIVRDYVTIEYDLPGVLPGINIDLKKSPLILDIDFRPRSSIYKTGLVLANSIGTLE